MKTESDLQPNERILRGNWIVQDGRVRGDAVCERIEWLISYRLHKIAVSLEAGAWETLYQDPDDGRYWERTYPQGEMHGGGPPQLKQISSAEIGQKYPQLLCPVCGFQLWFEPWSGLSASDEICPSCGIQFGYSDFAGGDIERRPGIYREWRRRWIEAGTPWLGKSEPPPADWNPVEQLKRVA